MYKNVLITGGAGFIGSNIARKLIKEKWNVTIFDNFLPQVHGDNCKLADDLNNQVKLIIGDVTNKDEFTKLSVKEIKELLRSKGLIMTGNKSELINRLINTN